MLCKDTNLTVIVRLFRREALLHLDRKANVMKGLLGDKWDSLLGKRPYRSCKLIPADQLGTQASPQNSSFNGAFGLLQRKEGDFCSICSNLELRSCNHLANISFSMNPRRFSFQPIFAVLQKRLARTLGAHPIGTVSLFFKLLNISKFLC